MIPDWEADLLTYFKQKEAGQSVEVSDNEDKPEPAPPLLTNTSDALKWLHELRNFEVQKGHSDLLDTMLVDVVVSAIWSRSLPDAVQCTTADITYYYYYLICINIGNTLDDMNW